MQVLLAQMGQNGVGCDVYFYLGNLRAILIRTGLHYAVQNLHRSRQDEEGGGFKVCCNTRGIELIEHGRQAKGGKRQRRAKRGSQCDAIQTACLLS